MTYTLKYMTVECRGDQDLFHSTQNDDRVSILVATAQTWVNNNQYGYDTMRGFRLYHNDDIVFEVHKNERTNSYPTGTIVTHVKVTEPSIRPRSVIEI